MNKTMRKGIHLAAAFAGVYGISYLMNFREETVFSFSVFTVLCMAALVLIYEWAGKRLEHDRSLRERRREILFSAFTSLALGTAMVLGYQLQYNGMTDGGVTGKLRILLRGACVGATVLPLAGMFFRQMETRSGKLPEERQERRWKPVPIFFCGWLGIWLCWLPVWLAYYPVIMSYDFHAQSLQAFLGIGHMYSHHPVAHTVLIYLFRNLGVAIGSYEIALALFCQMQQMILSAALGYAVVMIYRLTGRKAWTVISAVFFAIFPVVSVFAMCTTKDVLFSAFFLLFLLIMIERVHFSDTKRKKILTDVFLIMIGILMMLFRNNAWYAAAAAGVLLVICAPRREKLRILMISAVLLTAEPLVRSGIEKSVDAGIGGEIEPYSVIIQCMTRVGYLHGDTMSQEMVELIDTYVTADCWEGYNPVIADSAKTTVYKDNWLERGTWSNIGEVIQTWLKVGLQYPNEYLDAWLQLTRGYWFLDDTSHAEMLGTEDGMGLLYTYNSYETAAFEGFEPTSKWIWLKDKLERVLTQNCYYNVPVLSNLFKPAVWCWALVLIAVVYLYKREKKNLLLIVYPLAYFGTMLLGPTAIIRYVIPLIVSVPVLLALVGRADS